MNNEVTKILGTSVRIGECILTNTQAYSSSPWALGIQSSLPSHSPSSVLIILQHPQHLSITLLRGSSLSCPRSLLSSDLSSSDHVFGICPHTHGLDSRDVFSICIKNMSYWSLLCVLSFTLKMSSGLWDFVFPSNCFLSRVKVTQRVTYCITSLTLKKSVLLENLLALFYPVLPSKRCF